ncbi:hypothetical protein BN59_01879 [Legionella massiliensis]|uniref:Uncharacterized protein n=1 Tax=Legionella massiliensis TaxID=1034943 RepID=A0A078KT20_9GAMM|nr:hypothetical protein [Legionella massiliensis]CDZ77595.1 hypothetical protein BN59_01879 [Legionella massiliensis]CEE13333.1 hypothetical protein BN1094_01879 [Legionella massiliensis]
MPATGVAGIPRICKTQGFSSTPDPNLCSQASSVLTINATIDPVTAAILSANSTINQLQDPLKIVAPPGLAWQINPNLGFAKTVLANATGIATTAKLRSFACGASSSNLSYCAVAGDDKGKPVLYQGTTGILGLQPIDMSSIFAGTDISQGQINQLSCTTPPNGIRTCAAIGVGTDSSANLTSPFILQTIDNGKTWKNIISDQIALGPQITLNSVDCTANGSATLCQVTGQDTGPNSGPILYYNSDSTNWQTYSLASTVISPQSSTGSISCASLPNADIHCLITLNNNDANAPTLIFSNLIGNEGTNLIKGGNYGAAVTGSAVTRGNSIIYNGVGCTENAGGSFCSAAGSSDGTPFVVQTDNLLSNVWKASVQNQSQPGVLTSVGCSSTGGNVFCNAAGQSTTQTALLAGGITGLAYSTSAAKVWAPVTSIETAGVRYSSAASVVAAAKPARVILGVNSNTQAAVMAQAGADNAWVPVPIIAAILTPVVNQ